MIERFSDTKMERIWDLFTQAIESCQNAQNIKLLFYVNIDFEENFGFTKYVY